MTLYVGAKRTQQHFDALSGPHFYWTMPIYKQNNNIEMCKTFQQGRDSFRPGCSSIFHFWIFLSKFNQLFWFHLHVWKMGEKIIIITFQIIRNYVWHIVNMGLISNCASKRLCSMGIYAIWIFGIPDASTLYTYKCAKLNTNVINDCTYAWYTGV